MGLLGAVIKRRSSKPELLGWQWKYVSRRYVYPLTAPKFKNMVLELGWIATGGPVVAGDSISTAVPCATQGLRSHCPMSTLFCDVAIDR